MPPHAVPIPQWLPPAHGPLWQETVAALIVMQRGTKLGLGPLLWRTPAEVVAAMAGAHLRTQTEAADALVADQMAVVGEAARLAACVAIVRAGLVALAEAGVDIRATGLGGMFTCALLVGPPPFIADTEHEDQQEEQEAHPHGG